MVTRRKDSKNRVLKEGEYERENGTFEYKWRDRRSKRHSIYAKTIEELRNKENDILRDSLDGIREDGKNLTINDLYNRWVRLKRGLKDNTFQGYQYTYKQFIEKDFGETRIVDLKSMDVREFYNMLADERGLKVATIDCVHTDYIRFLNLVYWMIIFDTILQTMP